MSGKNTALFTIYPTQGMADAAVDSLRAPMPAKAATMGPAAMAAPDQPPPPAPLADFLPNSWPNSGFRNSRQRGRAKASRHSHFTV